MTRFRVLLVAFALSLGLNVGLLYVRHAGKPPRGPSTTPPIGERADERRDPEAMVESHLTGLVRDLDLTPSQAAAIRPVLTAHMGRMTELLAATTRANERIAEAFAAPRFDEAAFRRFVAEASAARTRADSLSAVMLLGEAGVLTPEQRARFSRTAPTVYSSTRRPGPSEAGSGGTPALRDAQRPPRPDGDHPPPPGDNQRPPRPGDDRPPPPGDDQRPPRPGDDRPAPRGDVSQR